VTDRLYVVSIRIEDKRTVIIRVVVRARLPSLRTRHPSASNLTHLELAKKEENSLAKKEFLELADICEEVANDMDDRRVSG
jgi:hypothetical protein